jgi:hypothetical protein
VRGHAAFEALRIATIVGAQKDLGCVRSATGANELHKRTPSTCRDDRLAAANEHRSATLVPDDARAVRTVDGDGGTRVGGALAPAPARFDVRLPRQSAENDLLVAAELFQTLLQRPQQLLGRGQLGGVTVVAELLNQSAATDDALVRFADSPLELLQIPIRPRHGRRIDQGFSNMNSGRAERFQSAGRRGARRRSLDPVRGRERLAQI